jgi:hypothetical protein
MKVAFIAGPYRGETPWDVELNIRRAEELAFWVATQGVSPLCPHTNSRFFDKTITDEFWLAATTELLHRCDALILVEGWEGSSGVRGELDEAKALGLPVFESDDAGRIDFVRWSQR